MKLKNTVQFTHRPAQTRTVSSLLALLAGVLLAPSANAAGFGEITLHSRIGENLLAEVILLGSGKDLTNPNCYALAARQNGDLPVIANAHIRVTRYKDNYRLLIIGNRPIVEPAFVISLRAKCGIDLQHDYVLTPDPPAPVTEIVANSDPIYSKWSTDQDATNLPNTEKSQKAQESKGRPTKTAGRRLVKRDAQQVAQSNKPKPETPKVAPAAPSGDRLVIGAAPPELNPGETASPKTTSETEERVLKMETSLSNLNQEVAALNTSLQLAGEMQAAKRELQEAQAAQQLSTNAPIAKPETPARDPSAINWLELVLSSLLGGALVIGITTYLSRRKRSA